MFFSRRKRIVPDERLRRLLVVEDDALVAFDHEHDLLAAGYEVVATVNCGATAIAALVEKQPDAIILDLNLAGDIAGADVARLAHDRGIIVLVASADPPGSASHHAVAHLGKPFANGALVAALRAVEARLYQGQDGHRVAGLTMLGGQSGT